MTMHSADDRSVVTSIQAEALSFSQLFEIGRFSVPWHQRYYDWDKVHVEALLNDIEEARREKRVCYFLGSIMLIDSGHGHWQINDGQQRMITVSLIIAWLCRRASDENPDHQRVKTALDKLFVLPRDQVCNLDDADGYEPRIEPPRNDRSRYHQLIRGHSIGANGKLTSAWEEINAFLTTKSPESADLYFDYLVQSTVVAVLRIPRTVDANAVYETLNFRGKKLDDVDLIRNYLYSFFSEDSEKPRRDVVHDSIERIGDVSRQGQARNKSAEEYMRCHLQCRFGFLRSKHFYHDFRRKLRGHLDGARRLRRWTDGETVFRLIENLSDPAALQLFRMISTRTPDPETVTAFESASRTTRKRRRLSVFLRELRNYKVVQPLLFSMLMMYRREGDGRRRRRIAKEIHKTIERLCTFVLRTAFVAPKFEPSHYEEDFANFSQRVAADEQISETDFTALLRAMDFHGVLDAAQFQDSMSRIKRMSGSVKIRSLLLGINSTMTGDFSLLNEDRCTIEHILPRSSEHWAGWHGFSTVDAGEYVWRLGNLTLMGPDDNKPGKEFNASFGAKRQSFTESTVAMTRKVAEEWKDWNPEAIAEREKSLIRRALRVWTFED